MELLLRVLINNVRDAHRRHNLQQIRRQALEQSAEPLSSHSLDEDIPNPTRIRPRMQHSPLTLQSRPQQVNRIHHRRAQSAGEAADQRGRERSRQGIILMAFPLRRIARRDRVLQMLKRCQVDCSVGKHADEAHGQASVIGTESSFSPHLLRGLDDEGITVETALDGFALHAEFQRVERVNEELRGHAADATGDEAGHGRVLLWVTMAFEFGADAFHSLWVGG